MLKALGMAAGVREGASSTSSLSTNLGNSSVFSRMDHGVELMSEIFWWFHLFAAGLRYRARVLRTPSAVATMYALEDLL